MSRKRLPKAIVPSRGGLQETSAHAIIDEAAAEPRAASRTNGAGAGAMPAVASPPVESQPLPVLSAEPQPPSWRRSKARKIVERYRLYAAMGGLTPVPVVNVAGVTTIILRMVKVLSRLYDV